MIDYIRHNGSNIMYIDYSHCKSQDEMITILYEVGAALERMPTPMLTLSNFEGANVGSDFMSVAKELGNGIFATKIEKGALVGITGMKKILLKSYNMFAKDKQEPFDTIEQAKEYLIS